MVAKRVVVTGGAGFIGSEFIKQLDARGCKVRVIDDLSQEGHDVAPGVDFQRAELGGARHRQRPLGQGCEGFFNRPANIGGIGYFHEYPETILSRSNQLYSMTLEAATKHQMQPDTPAQCWC